MKDALVASGGHDVTATTERGFTGIEFVVLGLIATGGLANIVMRLLPLWKCGVIVDARDANVVTRKDCDLPRGTVLVLEADGTRSTFHEPSQVQLHELLQAATAGSP